jgi:methylase of polypeptide subunit release factors
MHPSAGTGQPNQPDASGLEPAAAHEVLAALKTLGYRFVAPTPSTHERVLRRRSQDQAHTIRDVLGWSLPFGPGVLPGPLLEALEAARALTSAEPERRARVRVSSLGGDLFFHAPFPPSAEDAVFFGPDTYRFARFLSQTIPDGLPVRRLIDVGTGSGAGAVVAARLSRPAIVTVTDITAHALATAAINLRAAGVRAEMVLSDGLADVAGDADLIIANPPFIAGAGGRTYRDGGDLHGAKRSLDWALAGADRLTAGGRLILYTGVAVVDGQDQFERLLRNSVTSRGLTLDYQEIDPDIFGEMLGSTLYEDVERIAAIGAIVKRPL